MPSGILGVLGDAMEYTYVLPWMIVDSSIQMGAGKSRLPCWIHDPGSSRRRTCFYGQVQ